MVKPRKTGDALRQEFAGGLLPNLTRQPQGAHEEGTAEQQDGLTAEQLDVLMPKQQNSQARKKVTLYLDEPTHTDLMDDLLTLLKRSGLPRDNSMLVRALLDLARPALTDRERFAELAAACVRTLPNR